jgi:SHS family lactate transporter-like MFS transporter
MEHARPDTRGVVSGLLQTGYPAGGLLAAGAAALLLPEHGWRVLVMLSAIPALLVLFIRAGVPESPGFKAGQRQSAALAPSALAAGGIGVALVIFGQLALFAMLLMAGFNALSHGTQDFYSNFLRVQHGFDARTASLVIMAGSFGAILGGLTSGALSQVIGRRRMITIGALLVLPMIPLWVFWSTTPAMFALAVFALQFMVQGAWGVVPAHLNEISPGDVRGTFPGFTYQVGNLLSAGVAYGQTSLVVNQHWQYGQALALAAVCAAVAIAVLINLGPEGRHVVMSETQ